MSTGNGNYRLCQAARRNVLLIMKVLFWPTIHDSVGLVFSKTTLVPSRIAEDRSMPTRHVILVRGCRENQS